MARDRERDAEMDRLLRAAMADGPEGTAGACPAAEELAAYFDRALAPREREALEPHLASCERCQQTLALMATMAETPATAARAAARTPFWRFAGWRRWLIPTTALATGVILYVALKPAAVLPPDRSPDSIVATTTSETPTPLERSGVPQQLAEEAEPTPAPTAEAAPPRTKSEKAGADEAPRVRARARGETLADQSQAKAEARPFGTADAEARQGAPIAQVPELAAAPVAALPSPPSAEPEVMAEARKAQPGGGAVGVRPTRLPAAEAVAPEGAVLAGSRAAPDAAAVAPQQIRSTARPEGTQAAIVKGAGAKPFFWRLGPGARIFGSADAGRTWHLQYTGTGRLVSGSSPSPEVCWVVGDRGLVLRTTDGRTWNTVTFPEPLDLVAVLADSDRRATVHASGGRRFTTEDGGETWRE